MFRHVPHKAHNVGLAVLFAAGTFYLAYRLGFKTAKDNTTRKNKVANRASVKNRNRRSSSEEYMIPPLPETVVNMLNASRLCHMATQSVDMEPHLSLMNYTYYKTDEVIIMCTRRDTKKFKQLQACPAVALLIHDFPQLKENQQDQGTGRSFSITLNGTVSIPAGDDDIKYRNIHLKKNMDYKQFIQGDNISVVLVSVERARIVDSGDRVQHWDTKNGMKINPDPTVARVC